MFVSPRSPIRGTVLVLLGVLTGAHASGQEPFGWDLSVERRADGLKVPLQLGMDAGGVLYAGSGWVNAGSSVVPIYAVPPSGHWREVAKVDDPDALAVGPNGLVYTGAWGGRIFEIDPQTGSVSTWASSSQLGNIDGMTWWNGDLYTVAIDHPRAYRVDGTTRAVSLFADFGGVGFTGLTGIVFDPFQARAFFGSPWENRIVATDLAGAVIDPAVATGFQFLGHLAFDATGAHGGDLFCADNGAGEIWRIDLATGQRDLHVGQLRPLTGGLCFDAQGRLWFSRVVDSGAEGELWRDAPMTLSAPPLLDPRNTTLPALVSLDSPADAGQAAFFVASLDPRGFTLPGGRAFPVGPGLATLLGWRQLDAAGRASVDLKPWALAPGVRGVTFFVCAFTRHRELRWLPLVGITSARSVTIPANRPPVIVAPWRLHAQVGQPVQLDASGSFDEDRDPLGFVWDPGDGSPAVSGAVILHTYGTTGTFHATIQVTDGLATTTHTVKVVVS